MSAILGWMAAKGGAVAVGAAIPLVFVFLKKFVPNKVGSIIVSVFEKEQANLDKVEDPKLKELLENISLDIVKLAEYAIPDEGKGGERYKLAAEWICRVIPLLKGQDDRVEAIIEKAVVRMDAELKKKLGE